MIIEAANQYKLGEVVLFNELKSLRERQLRRVSKMPRPPEDFTDSKAILKIFLETNRFKQIYQNATEIFQQSMSGKERQRKKERFAGRIFQDLAYIYISWQMAQIESSQVLLSPELTLEFYQYLSRDFLGKKVDTFPFGLTALENISVPDGIAVDDQMIKGLYEYTLERVSQQFIDSRNYSLYLDRKKFSGFEPETGLTVVMPKGQSGLNLKSVKVIQLPFTRSEFRESADRLYSGLFTSAQKQQ